MGPDVILLGSPALKEVKADTLAQPALRMVILYCFKRYPHAGAVDIKDPSALVAGGHRVGSQSDLHVLRGVAIGMETNVAGLTELDEAGLAVLAEHFYAQSKQATTLPHLIIRPDDRGFYVPFEVAMPMFVGPAKGRLSLR